MTINIFINPQIYIYLDLVVLAITLFLNTYFIIKPIKTLCSFKALYQKIYSKKGSDRVEIRLRRNLHWRKC